MKIDELKIQRSEEVVPAFAGTTIGAFSEFPYFAFLAASFFAGACAAISIASASV
jgi:hypothetical protein